MKTLDVIVMTLLIVGGLNWGLVGLFNLDLVATFLGNMTAFSRTIYIVVGLSAIYLAMTLVSAQRRRALARADVR